MKTIDKLRRTLALTVLGVGVIAGLPAQAYTGASGTEAGQSIVNNVALDYTVGNVGLTESTSVEFLVDRKFDVVVQQVATEFPLTITPANNAVAPGQAAAPLLFTVTNQSNFAPEMLLAAFGAQIAVDDTVAIPAANNEPTGVDLSNPGGAGPGGPIGTFVQIRYNPDEGQTSCTNDLVSSTQDQDYVVSSVFNSDDVILVCVEVDIPEINGLAGTTIGDQDYFSWTLAAAPGIPGDGGVWISDDNTDDPDTAGTTASGGNNPNNTSLENVFGDLTAHQAPDWFYDFTNDSASDSAELEDGQHSDTSAFIVLRPVLEVTKQSLTVWDPINGLAGAGTDVTATTNSAFGDPFDQFSIGTYDCTSSCPKSIPGALIFYEIVVTNSGTASASGVTISDALDASVTEGVSEATFTNFETAAGNAVADVNDGNGTILVDRCTAENNASGGAQDGLEAFVSGDVDVTLGLCGAGETATLQYYVTLQ